MRFALPSVAGSAAKSIQFGFKGHLSHDPFAHFLSGKEKEQRLQIYLSNYRRSVAQSCKNVTLGGYQYLNRHTIEQL